MKYQVLVETICDGWVNCWEWQGVFNSIDEAEYEIAECLELCEQAGMTGYSRADYKIEEVAE